MKPKIQFLLMTLLCMSSVSAINAQDRIRYQGDVKLGYSIDVGEMPANSVNIHMVNGVRLNEYLSTGVGLGLNIYRDGDSAIPIYWDITGYLPVSNVTSLFLSADLGGSIGAGNFSGLGGLMFSPTIGASFNIANTKAINVGFGYVYQKWKERESIFNFNTDALIIKVGFSF